MNTMQTRKRRVARRHHHGLTKRTCRVYAAGCAACDAYRFYMEHGRFVHNFEELWAYMGRFDVDAPTVSWSMLTHDYALKEKA